MEGINFYEFQLPLDSNWHYTISLHNMHSFPYHFVTDHEKWLYKLQRLKQEEEEREKEYNRLRNTQAKAGIMMERELERKRKQLMRDQADENRRLSAEQKFQ